MNFRKYICTACFKAFAKKTELGILTDCPHCETKGSLTAKDTFDRRQPWEPKLKKKRTVISK